MYSGTDLQDSSQKTHELRFSNQQNHIQVTDKLNDYLKLTLENIIGFNC